MKKSSIEITIQQDKEPPLAYRIADIVNKEVYKEFRYSVVGDKMEHIIMSTFNYSIRHFIDTGVIKSGAIYDDKLHTYEYLVFQLNKEKIDKEHYQSLYESTRNQLDVLQSKIKGCIDE